MSVGLATKGVINRPSVTTVAVGNLGYIDIDITTDEYNIQIDY